MDELTSLGLRIDESENLRIISHEAEQGSVELSAKTKLILERKYNSVTIV